LNSDLLKVFLIVIALDVVLFLFQFSITEINPSGPLVYNYEGSTLQKYDTGGYSLNVSNAINQLPESNSVEASTGNVFVDTYSTLKSWFLIGASGLSYLYVILSGPSIVLAMLGAPTALTFAIGALWYAFTLFLIIAFITGRSQ